MTTAELDALLVQLRSTYSTTARRPLYEQIRNEHIAQEATIARLRETAEQWEALWRGEADRAAAMEEEVTRVKKCLTYDKL